MLFHNILVDEMRSPSRRFLGGKKANKGADCETCSAVAEHTRLGRKDDIGSVIVSLSGY